MANSYKKDLVEKVKNPSLRKFFENKYSFGIPVTAVAAVGTLTLDGVVIDGETVTIDGDVYEFCADTAQSVTTVGNIAVDITSFAAKATGTLTVAVNPTADDTITIGTTEYVFKASADEALEIPIGLDVAATQVNIVAAVNGTDGINTAHGSVSLGDFATNASTVTALVGGTAGNSIATTSSFTSGSNLFSAATLGSGDDCSAAEADGALIGANEGTTYALSQGSGTTVLCTAATKGVAGNSIAVSETMANGTWGSGITTLGDTTAGVDATIGIAGDIMIDATNHRIYIAEADNGVADANWKYWSLI